MTPRRVRMATWILRCLLPRRDVEAIVGDLEEERVSRQRSPAGDAWYWAQILRSLPWCLWLPVQRGGWPSTVGVTAAVCVLQASIEVATALVAYAWLGDRVQGLMPLTSLAILVSFALLTYHATRIRPGSVTMVPAVTLVLIGVRLLATHSGQAESLGTLFVSLMAAPSTAFIGGVVSVRRYHR